MGALGALITLSDKIFNLFLNLGANLENIDSFYVVTKKINKLLCLNEETKQNYLYNLDGDIIFSNVNVYINDIKILENLNFIIKKGDNVAIIGGNGSGKSIIAKTILGFYDYDGNIYINNHNIKRLNKENIRKYVELVLGESYMFSGSIYENIKLNSQTEDKQIKEVIKNCEIKTDIEKFSDGINTLVGEKGTKLSGGQKQRICIARSLISNKPIIILDEALNKIDNITRKKILDNLKNKYYNKTIIFISNNLEIIQYVDNVIYISTKTTTIGKNEELLQKNKEYKKMIEISKNVV